MSTVRGVVFFSPPTTTHRPSAPHPGAKSTSTDPPPVASRPARAPPAAGPHPDQHTLTTARLLFAIAIAIGRQAPLPAAHAVPPAAVTVTAHRHLLPVRPTLATHTDTGTGTGTDMDTDTDTDTGTAEAQRQTPPVDAWTSSNSRQGSCKDGEWASGSAVLRRTCHAHSHGPVVGAGSEATVPSSWAVPAGQEYRRCCSHVSGGCCIKRS